MSPPVHSEPSHFKLSTNSQVAPRPYTRFTLCFPYHEGVVSKDETVRSLQIALDRAVHFWPFLQCTVCARQKGPGLGRMYLSADQVLPDPKSHAVPLQVRHHEDDELLNFDRLRSERFREESLNCKILSSSVPFPADGVAVPLLSVTANFVRGGLIIAIYFHHTISDGPSMGRLIELLAQTTHPQNYEPAAREALLRDEDLESTIPQRSTQDITQLMKDCPEHIIARTNNPLGPSQPSRNPHRQREDHAQNPVQGVIFPIPAERVRVLKDKLNFIIQRKFSPDLFASTNDVLGAVTWSHVMRARHGVLDLSCRSDPASPAELSLTPQHSPVTTSGSSSPTMASNASSYDVDDTHITITVNNRKRLRPNLKESYIGYGISIAQGHMPLQTLRQAQVYNTSPDGLMPLVRAALSIRRATDEVDDAFVRRRLALMWSLTDVRALDLTYNVEDHTGMRFNTWASLGMKEPWKIPGVPSDPGLDGTLPEAIRRTHDAFTNGGNIVMPRRNVPDAPWEVLVQLRKADMERLRDDPSWRHWVDQEVT